MARRSEDWNVGLAKDLRDATVAREFLAAALWLRDEKARARQIIEAMGDSPEPLWGRVVYHLLTSDLDAAADWYGRMIEHRDPFALVYARASVVEPLRPSSLARARCAYEATAMATEPGGVHAAVNNQFENRP